MSIIKQISVFDGSSWGIDDIGANAGNIDLIAPSSTVTTNLAGSSNLFTALNNILPSDQLTASRALVTDANKKLAVSSTTATQLGYVHGVTSAIQTQINTLNTKLITGTVISGVNLNNYTETGLYKTNGNITNSPTGNYGFMFVYKETNNISRQIYFPQGSNGMFLRRYYEGVWQSWYSVSITQVTT